MKTKRLFTLLIALAVTAVPATAEETEYLVFREELDACLSALNDNLDFSGVQRVRHIVTRSKEKRFGFSLTIQTSTYAPEVERKYWVNCVAHGSGLPSRLRIQEVLLDASK